ncbi:MAG: preprotein translocase subunit SecE [Desulfobacteraceae bacterium]|nr:preprotein translocase subunit SecE [Desulfobacteraceae bacterium]
MSRLHKKKPLSEKKKKREVSQKNNNSEATVSKSSSSKSAKVASPLKSKQDKSLTDAMTGEPNFFQRAMRFFQEVQVELKKVTWPTRKQTTGTTIVVIIFVFVVAAFLGLFDFGLSKLVQVVLT